MRPFLIASMIGLVGCTGQLDTPAVGSGTNPNPNGNASIAKKMFEDTVYPIIHNPGQASDCSQCHDAGGPVGNVTGFVASDVADAYATATSFQAVVGNFTPATAEIVTQVQNQHEARAYTDQQMQQITSWLTQEVAERSNQTLPPETARTATARVMNEFSACMNIDDYKTAGMPTAWKNMTAGGSACTTCHATGAYSMIVSGLSETAPTGGPPGMFTTITTNKYYMIQYFTVDLTGSEAKVIVNQTSFDGVAKGLPPHASHPRFNSTDNPGMTALKKFYDLTMQKVMVHNCGPTKLNPPAS